MVGFVADHVPVELVLYWIVPPEPPDTDTLWLLPSYAPLYAVTVGQTASALFIVSLYVAVASLYWAVWPLFTVTVIIIPAFIEPKFAIVTVVPDTDTVAVVWLSLTVNVPPWWLLTVNVLFAVPYGAVPVVSVNSIFPFALATEILVVILPVFTVVVLAKLAVIVTPVE